MPYWTMNIGQNKKALISHQERGNGLWPNGAGLTASLAQPLSSKLDWGGRGSEPVRNSPNKGAPCRRRGRGRRRGRTLVARSDRLLLERARRGVLVLECRRGLAGPGAPARRQRPQDRRATGASWRRGRAGDGAPRTCSRPSSSRALRKGTGSAGASCTGWR